MVDRGLHIRDDLVEFARRRPEKSMVDAFLELAGHRIEPAGRIDDRDRSIDVSQNPLLEYDEEFHEGPEAPGEDVFEAWLAGWRLCIW